jgi:uncharacterized protein (DUF433 family)
MATNDLIVCRPGVLGGKPCIKGTRLSVEFILELFASGGDRAQVRDAYPELTDEAINAALDYAAHAVSRDVVWDTKVPA